MTHCVIVKSRPKRNGEIYFYVYGPQGYSVPDTKKRMSFGHFKSKSEAQEFIKQWEKEHCEFWKDEETKADHEAKEPDTKRRSPGMGTIKCRNGKYEVWSPRSKRKNHFSEYIGTFKTSEEANEALNKWIKDHDTQQIQQENTDAVMDEVIQYLEKRALSGDKEALRLYVKINTARERSPEQC